MVLHKNMVLQVFFILQKKHNIVFLYLKTILCFVVVQQISNPILLGIELVIDH
jgi:hypothetical protein